MSSVIDNLQEPARSIAHMDMLKNELRRIIFKMKEHLEETDGLSVEQTQRAVDNQLIVERAAAEMIVALEEIEKELIS